MIGYNEAHHLARCLDSIASQDYGPKEIIYVDSSSADSSVSIAERFVDKIYVVDCRGAPYARNFGVSKASYDLLVVVDGNSTLSAGSAAEVVRAHSEGYDLGRFAWGSFEPGLKNRVADFLLGLPSYRGWQAFSVTKPIVVANPFFELKGSHNDVGAWAFSLGPGVSVKRLHSVNYSFKESFKRKGYSRSVADWLLR
ncbi:glycosyltransferase family 2 protein [Candidatus Woesearchaeota archaeon]|nr:glycosyltransferase family 2 protein [Candidatus Woesearchaeota archaeon]